MHEEPNCQAVMLVGFGGPTMTAEVRPFLDRVLAGRPVPRERYEEVVRHYEAIGGHSPYNESTLRLSAAVRGMLQQRGIDTPVATVFRNMPPFADEALHDFRQRRIRRVLGFIVAPQRSEASWDRYVDDITLARQRVGGDAPEVEYPAPWHADPGFVEAVAENTQTTLQRLDPGVRERAELIFTVHSIPLSMPGRAQYVEQANESAHLVARLLGRASYTLAFQSRSGSPRDPWLEPHVNDLLRQPASGHVVLVPLGFLCDHVEVLYDLDIEAAKTARDAGITMVRASTICDHPKFVQMIARIAAHHLSPPAPN